MIVTAVTLPLLGRLTFNLGRRLLTHFLAGEPPVATFALAVLNLGLLLLILLRVSLSPIPGGRD